MNLTRIFTVFAMVAALAASTVAFAAGPMSATTNKFEGAKANTGMAMLVTEGGKRLLRVTPDFKVPDTPAPTWRVVDSKGNIYTLDAFKIKDGEKREVVLPNYVADVAKVQVYCAWAQVLLGEASFAKPVM